MKSLFLTLMLYGLASADVSHLNRGSHFGGSLPSNNYHSHVGHSANSGHHAGSYIRVLKNDYVNDGHGHYNFQYETENGINHNEDGNPDNSKRGQYSYTGDDGKVYTVMYWADETGFHAVGDHIPGNENNPGLGVRASSGHIGGSGGGHHNAGGNGHHNKGNHGNGGHGNHGHGGGGNGHGAQKNGYDYAKKSGYDYKPPTDYLPPATDYLPPKF